jgi:hypothetical protein
VTAFYLKTRESFKAMKNSTFIYPLSEYKVVMDWVQKVRLPSYPQKNSNTPQAAKESDESIEAVAVGIIDPATQVPRILTSFLCFQQTESAAEASLAHINASHPPGAIMEAVSQPTSLANEYCGQDLANPHSHRTSPKTRTLKTTLMSRRCCGKL